MNYLIKTDTNSMYLGLKCSLNEQIVQINKKDSWIRLFKNWKLFLNSFTKKYKYV